MRIMGSNLSPKTITNCCRALRSMLSAFSPPTTCTLNMRRQPLEAGKHVLCTKPMVTTMADCERLVHLVDRTGLKFVAAMTWRHLPKIVAARRAFDEGKLGKVTLIDTGYVHDIRRVCEITPWRVTAPQDFLFGGGAHAIDCVRWFCREY